jgi:hypothetical protein
LSGKEKPSADRPKEPIKFVTIELTFVSSLKSGEITNFGTFSSSSPELFETAETIPSTIVKVESANKDDLGQVKIGPAYQFNSKETGGKWFFSYQKANGSVRQAVIQITVIGHEQERIGTFPVSVIVPSQ